MKSNKLANESSPYLRGHAFNPVGWHPWTEEVFASARICGNFRCFPPVRGADELKEILNRLSF